MNHFQFPRGLTTKTGLIKSLDYYYKNNRQAVRNQYTVFHSIPLSFLLRIDDKNSRFDLQKFIQITKKGYHSCMKNTIAKKHCQENFWLVKPHFLNRGRGIGIFNDPNKIEKFLSSKKKGSKWVAQKYLEKPLLYKDRKFDIRVWVIVKSPIEVFIYRKGYIRTSSNAYTLKNLDNYIHLTNNCLQIHGDGYGIHEDGNTLPYETVEKFFQEKFPDLDFSIRKHIMPRIHDLIIDSVIS